jgi:myo-inositol-1(or 4)-monophosphatase
MSTFVTHTQTPISQPDAKDQALLSAVVEAVRGAGARLLEVFSPDARPADRAQMFAAGRRIQTVSQGFLQDALAAARPGVRWVGEDQGTVLLPPGEWWVVDDVEGAVNHVHGTEQWAVTVALVRDNTPVLAAVHQPVGDLTYTAIRGAGAYLNGRRLHTSPKTDLGDAIVITGQTEIGDDKEILRRIGISVTAMLERTLMVQMSVPSTFPLLQVATGHADAFWQYAPVLPGVAAGALLAAEAGGVISDLRGQPWRPGSPDILVAAPGVHAAALDVLSGVS